MKVYKGVSFVSCSNYRDEDIYKKIVKCINQYQENGYQVEVQYSICANNNNIVYSALILAYTEEPNV